MGEVIPGPITPLNSITEVLEITTKYNRKKLFPFVEANPWNVRMFVLHENHVFINLVDFVYETVGPEIEIDNHIAAIQFCGQM